MRALIVAAGFGIALTIVARPALASPDSPGSSDYRGSPIWERGSYWHWFGGLSYGRGVRFNNPFRLRTELGDDARGLSLTAGYVDVGLGVGSGDPLGFTHGAVAHLSIAAAGISQEVVSLSYLLQHPLARDARLFARAGIPLVIEPDAGAGLEAAVGGAYLLSGGVGVTAELTYDLFFGAATWEQDPSLWPIASLSVGVWVEYEVLP